MLRRAYGYQFGTVSGGAAADLPYAVVDDVCGSRVTALPFSDYLPIVDAEACAGYFAQLRRDYPDRDLSIKTLLSAADVEALGSRVPGLRVGREAVTYRITEGGARPNGKFRSNARRAVRDGLSVRRATDLAALDRFRRLFHTIRIQRFSKLPAPYKFFREIHETFIERGRGFYLEALSGGEVISSFVMLSAGRTLYHKFTGTDPERLVLRPTHLLFTHLIDLIDAGEYDGLDLGLTGVSEAYAGLRYFKESTGAAPTPIHYLEVRQVPESRAADFAAGARHINQLVDVTVGAELTPEQVDRFSEVIYPTFA